MIATSSNKTLRDLFCPTVVPIRAAGVKNSHLGMFSLDASAIFHHAHVAIDLHFVQGILLICAVPVFAHHTTAPAHTPLSNGCDYAQSPLDRRNGIFSTVKPDSPSAKPSKAEASDPCGSAVRVLWQKGEARLPVSYGARRGQPANIGFSHPFSLLRRRKVVAITYRREHNFQYGVVCNVPEVHPLFRLDR